MDNNYIGDKIRDIRRANGLSQEEFANAIDVSRQTVSTWETGKSFPDSCRLVKICKEFNIKAEEFFDENEVQNERLAYKDIEDAKHDTENKSSNGHTSFLRTLAGKLTIAVSVLFLAAVFFVIGISVIPSSKNKGIAYVVANQWNFPFDVNVVIMLTMIFISVIMSIFLVVLIVIGKKHKVK